MDKGDWQSHADFMETTPELKLSDKTEIKTEDRTFSMKVHVLDITVSQPKRPRTFLDVKIQGIGKLHTAIGGLLGMDDHSAVEELPEECKLLTNLKSGSTSNENEKWSATASL